MIKKTKVLLFLDVICYQRLTAPDFAQKQSFKIRLIHWLKGGAK